MTKRDFTGVIWSKAWRSITEAGFLAGVVATAFQLLDVVSGTTSTFIFFSILVAASVTILNIRLIFLNITTQPDIEYVSGHDETFDLLTRYVKGANDSVSVTRFSKGTIEGEAEYFDWTVRRLRGEGHKPPLRSYRRLMRIDSAQKAELVCSLLRKAGDTDNFYLKQTHSNGNFDLVIVDEDHAFICFQESIAPNTIDAALRISKPEVVSKFIRIFDEMWNNPKTEAIKEGPLSKEEQESLANKYSERSRNLRRY